MAAPGAIGLQRAILARFPAARNLGIYNPRDVCGNPWPRIRCALSTHAEGRAGDDGFPTVRPNGHPDGTRLAELLVGQADPLGVQEVIWAGKIWTALRPSWHAYKGRSDHFDHVHWTITRNAAATLTEAAAGIILDNGDDGMALTDDDIKRVCDRLMGDEYLGQVKHHIVGRADDGARLPRAVRALEQMVKRGQS